MIEIHIQTHVQSLVVNRGTIRSSTTMEVLVIAHENPYNKRTIHQPTKGGVCEPLGPEPKRLQMNTVLFGNKITVLFAFVMEATLAVAKAA